MHRVDLGGARAENFTVRGSMRDVYIMLYCMLYIYVDLWSWNGLNNYQHHAISTNNAETGFV